MPRILEIVLKARNEIGPAIAAAQADLKGMKQSVDTGLGFVKFGAAVGGVKAGLLGLTAIMKGIEGDTQAVAEAFYRLPFGIGEVARAAHELFNAMTGADKAAERLERRKIRDALGVKAAELGGDIDSRLYLGTASDSEKANQSSLAQLQKDLADAEKVYRESTYKTAEDFTKGYNDYARRAAEARLADERRVQKIQDDEREKSRVAYIAGLDRTHKIEVDKYMGAVRRRQEIDREEREQYLAGLRRRVADEERESQQNFADSLGALRRDDPGRGSTGTISGGDVTNNLRGLAFDAQAEERRRYNEERDQRIQLNRKVDQLIKINEQTGGDLARWLQGGIPL